MNNDSFERLISWLEDNQNKPVETVITVYELYSTKVFNNGYKLNKTSSSYELIEENKKDVISLFTIGVNDYKVDFIVGKENTELGADAELTINEHFMISFNFIK